MPIWKCKGDREGGICSFQSKRLESSGVTGVYSPSDNLRRTGFALETAVKRSALYLGMEAYGYGVQNRSMETFCLR